MCAAGLPGRSVLGAGPLYSLVLLYYYQSTLLTIESRLPRDSRQKDEMTQRDVWSCGLRMRDLLALALALNF